MENINLWMITAVSMKNGDVVRNDSIEGETQMAADKQASTHLDKYAEAGRAAIARDIDLSLAAAQGAATFEDALQVLAVHARLMIDAHQCALSYVPDGNFKAAIHTQFSSKKYEKYKTYDVMPTGEGIWGVIVEQKIPLRMTQEELVSYPCWKNFGGLKDESGLEHPPMEGWLAIPIVRRDGGFIGVLQLSDKKEAEFTEEDQKLLTRLGSVIAPTLELQYLLNKVQDRARQLEEKTRELEMFHDVAVGREEDMIKLKKQVNALSRELGRDEPHAVP